MRKNFKLTLVALSLLALTACSAEHEPTVGEYPILFGCTGTTRADVGAATIDDLKNNGFRVYAFVDGVNDISFTKDVYWVENDEVWAYDKLEYWVPGCNYSFRAFYPNPEDNYTLNVDTTSADLSYKINNFDITSQQDLMQASATTNVAQGDVAPVGGSVVSLQFKHLLANVTIKAKSQIDGVIIQEIVIGRADTNSTYNGSVWNLSGNTTTLEYSQPTTLTKGAEFVDVTNGGILVIPASANNKTLTIKANKTYKLEFPTGTWEPGKRYTYTLEIKQDDIIFVDDVPYVEEWDSENATGSVIIK